LQNLNERKNEEKTFANQLSRVFFKKGSTTTCYVKILAKQNQNKIPYYFAFYNWQYSG